KRRHLRKDAIAFCQEVRARRPDVVFGADLIAGFPTETDEMFENTRAIIGDCGLSHVHVFPFSPRTGTPAARMPQVPRSAVKARAAALRAEAATHLRAALNGQLGNVTEVLVEEGNTGRTPHYFAARLAGEQKSAGSIVHGLVTSIDGTQLVMEEAK
ncbi:MAG: tRNA (N(6)-L-threonylcarbamoyladenosine(37)-C(2))-methylthiotransferase MtaB, partial [Pseudomonadota bacterium]